MPGRPAELAARQRSPDCHCRQPHLAWLRLGAALAVVIPTGFIAVVTVVTVVTGVTVITVVAPCEELIMPPVPWNERYATNAVPWDTGEPDPQLVEFVAAGGVAPCRTLEIGCGTGTNALWLAALGFDVVGLDISSIAIDRAEAKRAERGLACEFLTADFLADPLPAGSFGFVFDRGCFHGFDDDDSRSQCAQHVAQLLGPGGVWLSVTGSTEGPARDHGPPRRSLRDIAHAIEPVLELVDVHTIDFHANLPSPARAWHIVARQRDVPAQPSSV